MPLTLTLVQDISPVIGLREITPDRLASLSADQIARLSLACGAEQVELGELFQRKGVATDQQLRLVGDFSRCDFLGAEMNSGSLTIEGNVGDHVGAAMKGGSLTVVGDAGDFVGSPNPGEKRGLQGGTIVIHGSAGRELGVRMRRGMIAVAGDVGELCGYRMLAGTIVVGGKLGRSAGLRMKRGTIVALSAGSELPATFARDCQFRPPMMTMLERELQQLGFPLPHAKWEGEFQLYSGDAVEMSRGEILVPVVG
ncbi:formylmethanofuran dehydrogenase subunit C [Blastopirellula sp. JC732]|uniref:Formylmethanofuran dehydrogenase subunit C n=1 Tax=Blastopirellula sediminis TaxID=2894196 RepID=A0A9X1SH02_9BACT|nr:formylmethanofuran dehydrogenase subunit C [Blastopirellula sediminis]MCC9606016.1 formylmethanofuran dehydrogenase subunit C [Blastopirellula sediminis]MCC9630685.1 formylmethanofuran dehydrogenase subunit C [Blastopirellula sediminis]